MSDLEIVVARMSEKTTIANLMQLYVHDFSEFWAGTANGELQEDGSFPAYPFLDTYWSDPQRVPLLIRLRGRLIGFALLNNASHAGQPVDRNMAEFFIVRKHRRSGTGTMAAQDIFARYPGRWEVAVARRNVGALAFWRNAITRHPNAQSIEEADVSTSAWDGPLFRFNIEPAR
jgi:predicted acetyltransferase